MGEALIVRRGGIGKIPDNLQPGVIKKGVVIEIGSTTITGTLDYAVSITQTAYNALTTEQKNNGTFYCISV